MRLLAWTVGFILVTGMTLGITAESETHSRWSPRATKENDRRRLSQVWSNRSLRHPLAESSSSASSRLSPVAECGS